MELGFVSFSTLVFRRSELVVLCGVLNGQISLMNRCGKHPVFLFDRSGGLFYTKAGLQSSIERIDFSSS